MQIKTVQEKDVFVLHPEIYVRTQEAQFSIRIWCDLLFFVFYVAFDINGMDMSYVYRICYEKHVALNV